ncbi:MAG: hypothetical protein RBU23_00880 [Candidatus Auribacterota bacterium]|jgi:hypothetical protein|nr:hypothetical protein [Candidatus Auribacterota bacterium]
MDDIQPTSFRIPADPQTPDRNKEQQSLLISAIDEVFERRHLQLCEKLGRIYAVSALVYLLSSMVLIIAGGTLKDFIGIYVLIPLGIVFGIGAIFKYIAAKNFFDHTN